MGRLAQAWAQGKDDRPVRATAGPTLPTLEVDFEPPTAHFGQALETTLAKLKPCLSDLSREMAGCRRLSLGLHFIEGSRLDMNCAFVEPVPYDAHLRATLTNQLQG